MITIFNGSGGETLAEFHPLHIIVGRTRRLTEYAIEDGSTLSDHIVDDPLEVTIDMIVTEEMEQAYSSLVTEWQAKTPMSIQTRTAVYDDMMLIGIPHEEPADMIGVTITLRFRQVRTATPKTGEAPMRTSTVKSPVQSDTQNRGEVKAKSNQNAETKAENSAKSSVAYSARGAISNWLAQ